MIEWKIRKFSKNEQEKEKEEERTCNGVWSNQWITSHPDVSFLFQANFYFFIILFCWWFDWFSLKIRSNKEKDINLPVQQFHEWHKPSNTNCEEEKKEEKKREKNEEKEGKREKKEKKYALILR